MSSITKPRLITVCLVCRIKRKKCDKAKPQCQHCRRTGAECVYSTRRRDLRTGRVSRGSEETPEAGEFIESDSEAQWYPEETINNEPAMHVQTLSKHYSLPLDHRTVQRGSRIRNVGKSFWAFVDSQERLSDAILFDEEKRPADLPPSHISSASLAKVLSSLPTKPVCEALVQTFLVSVFPIHPIVDRETFQVDYDAFWEWAAAGNLLPPAKLIEDPTFTCLLFAILYSGASVTPASTWQDSSSPLASIDRDSSIKQLSAACTDSLNACQHTAHPTVNTLIASILVHQFSSQDTPLERALFISTIIRLAQSMGLHRMCDIPEASSAFDHRNRIWKHITLLDVQSSIASGLPTCCHLIPSGYEDGSMGHWFASTLYFFGRHETARHQCFVISKVQSDITTETYDDEYQIATLLIQEFLRDIKGHLLLLDGFIGRIPASEDEHEDLIRLWENASPETHFFLYDEHRRGEANIVETWIRTMLSLLKLESVITLQKLFLGPPESTSRHRFWACTARLCVKYLQVYLDVCRTPAFEPYAWFFADYFAPRQCSLLILLYLKHHAQPENVQVARDLVNEFIDYICSRQGSDNTQSSKVPSDIKVLITLREEIDFKLLFQSGPFGAFSESTTKAESAFAEPLAPMGEAESAVAEIFTSFENWSNWSLEGRN